MTSDIPYKKTGHVFDKVIIHFFSLENTYHKTYHDSPLKRYGKMHNSASLKTRNLHDLFTEFTRFVH